MPECSSGLFYCRTIKALSRTCSAPITGRWWIFPLQTCNFHVFGPSTTAVKICRFCRTNILNPRWHGDSTSIFILYGEAGGGGTFIGEELGCICPHLQKLLWPFVLLCPEQLQASFIRLNVIIRNVYQVTWCLGWDLKRASPVYQSGKLRLGRRSCFLSSSEWQLDRISNKSHHHSSYET